MYAVYTIFPFGEMFLIRPGRRKGLDRFKAPGLMLSGITHLIEQTTDQHKRKWFYLYGKIPSIQSWLTFRLV